ncbi:MAG: hypothetical protein EHM14_07105 [Methanothrix sp.]|nr:MAG: hypothetical protein EHM14_07105 [Methanothrix sp.]
MPGKSANGSDGTDRALLCGACSAHVFSQRVFHRRSHRHGQERSR